MSLQRRIAVIGCGNLGLSIVNGLIESDIIENNNITATKRNITTIENLKDLGINTIANNKEAVINSEIILIAVKPYNILAVVEELKEVIDYKKHTIVSLATGITIQEIKDIIGEEVPVFRAMPNTAADVTESLTCIAHINENEEIEKDIINLFDVIGEALVIDENLMEAATVLGACGIAYVMRFIRAMIQGGVEIGFDAKTASKIVNQTVKGAAELLIERNNHPEYEIDKVTTPKGCTIVGLNQMEHNGFSSSLIKGIVTSYDKIS
jgi:pyrroline-5-carboxylate reductase